jgi:hypothetical protein
MKLSPSAQEALIDVITAYLVNDGYDLKEARQEALYALDDLEDGVLSFLLFDALGTDDEEIVAFNPELQKLYKNIEKTMTQSQKSLKH